MDSNITLYRAWLAWQSALTETDFNHRVTLAIDACDNTIERLWKIKEPGGVFPVRPRLWPVRSEERIYIVELTAEAALVEYWHSGDLEEALVPLAALTLDTEEISRWAGKIVDNRLSELQCLRDIHEANERETLHRLMEKYPDELEKVTAE